MTDDSTQKLGKRFWFVSWIIAFFMLYLFFDSQLMQRMNPNQAPTSMRTQHFTEVALERNAYHAYIANGFINGKQATFLVDTGASHVSIPGDLAAFYGLEKGYPITVTTANGRATAYQTRIKELKLGDIVLKEVKASISPGMKEIEILLGMSALKQLEFTQRGNTLTIRQYH